MSQPSQLHFQSHNPTNPTTILLIHGAFCSGSYWDLVTPHLSKHYHILIPDLPSHGKSTHITPFSIDSSVEHIANLIRTHTITKSAHIIGHSIGAHAAIKLATTYPGLVNDIFVSGFAIFPPSVLTPYIPYIAWPVLRIENLLPRSLLNWLMDGANLPHLNMDICTVKLCREITSSLTGVEWPVPWKMRTLIVAAAKGGVVPSADSCEYAKRLAEVGRKGNQDTIAVVHWGMRHPWNRQAPGLFAETAMAWLERRELDGGFVEIE